MEGMMRAATFRERMREEAAKAAEAKVIDPWRLTLERVRGKIDFYDGWNVSARRCCWTYLKCHNVSARRAHTGALHG
jgi:hypothetical protein